MDRALRLYADRWRFRHPTTPRLHRRRERRDRQRLEWFFDRTFYSSGRRRLRRRAGRRASRRSRRGASSRRTASSGRRARRRRCSKPRGYDRSCWSSGAGDVALPVEVLLRFEGGTTHREHWDGEARWTRFRVDAGPAARRGGRRPRREDPPRRGPHEQRPPHRGRRARRVALDGPGGLLGAEHDRLPDGGMVSEPRGRARRTASCAGSSARCRSRTSPSRCG